MIARLLTVAGRHKRSRGGVVAVAISRASADGNPFYGPRGVVTMRPAVTPAEDILRTHSDAIRNLCARLRVRKLEVFGSAVTARFDPARSDFDFLFEFQDMNAPDIGRRFLDLLEGLRAVLGVEVDLVDATAIENPYFLRKVNTQRRVLYAA